MSLDIAPTQDDRLAEEILSDDALAFVGELHGRFGARRQELLQARSERGAPSGFLEETREIREDSSWSVPAPRDDYADRRVEITGPTDRKLVINALNSGAKGFMADFEDANSPTWVNQVEGHANLIDAIEGTITYESADGKHYELDDEIATLLVRPRGWHLPEKHLRIDGDPVAGAFMDFGLHAFHNARRLHDKGLGLYLYLPKMEHHLEARLWNDVFAFSEEHLGVPAGTIRATVLIETLPASFQMEEILYELRDHSAGLNCGRWDYIFSVIKKFRRDPAFVLPDRSEVTMTVPFMRAYTDLLVRTCHRRGAYAMGGMAAYIPSRKDPEANDRALAKVAQDKEREAGAGFDGTWVAHPDLVQTATDEFDRVLGDRPNQVDRQRDDVDVTAERLLDVHVPGGEISSEGIRTNVGVGLRYLASWLSGVGAAAIDNLMEDAATAEISRSQLWQWVATDSELATGERVTADVVREAIETEMDGLRASLGEEDFGHYRFEEARTVFERVTLGDAFEEFFTLPAYELL